MIASFSIARLPRIEFGSGSLQRLPAIAAQYGRSLLLATGRASFAASGAGRWLDDALASGGFRVHRMVVAGEPSPADVDTAVHEHAKSAIEVVVGIGGGAVLDAAKAVAGLLRPGNSVMDHLEGVGPEKPYSGPATPFIALPTTAGTGSEATKNAVLSEHGPDGFKKSFRDDQLVAQWAIVDPDLLAGCPPGLIAANGMDALTQLLESYVSSRANVLTDALATDGLIAVRDGLLDWHGGADNTAAARSRMAYAAMLSGICLAQTGLGSVHGLAQPLGSLFPIPHGVVCGTLVAAATRVNIDALRARASDPLPLTKYAMVGRLFSGAASMGDSAALDALLATLENWTERLRLPRLSACGVGRDDLPRIVARSRGSSMKTNPVTLSDAEIAQVLALRL